MSKGKKQRTVPVKLAPEVMPATSDDETEAVTVEIMPRHGRPVPTRLHYDPTGHHPELVLRGMHLVWDHGWSRSDAREQLVHEFSCTLAEAQSAIDRGSRSIREQGRQELVDLPHEITATQRRVMAKAEKAADAAAAAGEHMVALAGYRVVAQAAMDLARVVGIERRLPPPPLQDDAPRAQTSAGKRARLQELLARAAQGRALPPPPSVLEEEDPDPDATDRGRAVIDVEAIDVAAVH